MKKIFLVLSLIIPLQILGYDFKVGNVCYKILSLQDKTCAVTSETAEGGYVGDLVIPSIVKYENIDFSVVEISYNAFASNYSLTSVTIPPSITEVETGAFASCYGLISVTIEDSNTPLKLSYNKIASNSYGEGEGLFLKSSLSKVYIGRPLTYLDSKRYGYSPFRGSKVKEVEFSETITTIPLRLFASCKNLQKVTLSKSIAEIKDFAFDNCISLTSISFNEGLQKIESSFLETGLISINIPASVILIDGSFRNCANLKTVIFNNDDVELGQYTFAGCSSIENITLPANMESIPQSLFEGCSSLKNLPIPLSVKSVDYHSFASCGALTDITLHEGFENIDDGAFSWCTNVTSVSLPSTTTYVGFHSFSDCQNIESVTCYASIPPACTTSAYENISFDNIVYLKAKLYVPDESVELYKSTSPWNNFVNIYPLSESGINNIVADEEIFPVVFYNTLGQSSKIHFEGINIVGFSNGTFKKIKY